ncbi:hypothetical protein FEM03_02310 [Phragmitibacter flavus]|uniref:Calcineurin-like phosphoesterase domain-containing protein n=1 Tax=Phragmitibacter flavus TaxID=2576071 RepID=A0A5R8KIX9_9BACT|nr:metallophosphoesterase [Phragmitibacter flavus]TLD72210.1 hypothetical protein FEM03_02310 [Phragmitibacter flavus]
MNINRRAFLKPLALSVIPASAFSQTPSLPPHAQTVPTTPFDAPPGTWTLAVFPDTQNLTDKAPEVFIRQTEWVAAHKASHDIRFVMHLGDITDHNRPDQWQNARKAYDILHQAKIPYSLLPGNHDLGPDGKAADRSTLLNDYFKPTDYSNSSTVHYFEPGKLENTAHTISTPTGELLIIALEFGPRDAVIQWADKIAAGHPNHFIIASTHAYLFHDDTRYHLEKYGKEQKWNPKTYPLAKATDVNEGEDLWQKLLSRHPNIHFMLSGHVLGDGTAHLISPGKAGQNIHQILSNYQAGVDPKRPYQGGGYFRLMQFLPDKKTVRIKTYSPWMDQFLTEPNQQFEVTL